LAGDLISVVGLFGDLGFVISDCGLKKSQIRIPKSAIERALISVVGVFEDMGLAISDIVLKKIFKIPNPNSAAKPFLRKNPHGNRLLRPNIMIILI
jgi:hypothetical protein